MLDDLDLAQRAPRYGFFALLRTIECHRNDLPRLGSALSLTHEAIRLGQDPDFAFVASPPARFYPAHNDRPARLTFNVLGLLGPQGPLPLSFSEYIFNRVTQAGDTSLRAFLDIFHHRLTSLYYRAWAAAQPIVAAERANDDQFARYIASLCGLYSDTDTPNNVHWMAQLHFAALLAGKRRSAAGLTAILQAYFALPVHIEQFAGEYMRITHEECTRLGRTRTPLGHGMVLGTRVWSASHRFRIVFGPLSFTDYQRMQPEGVSFAALNSWLAYYTAGQLDWQLELRLAPNAWRPTRFGSGLRLGRTSWLGRPKAPYLRLSPSNICATKAHHG